LREAGASELAFNAITALVAAKTLRKIAEAEGLPLGTEEAASIATCSGGVKNPCSSPQKGGHSVSMGCMIVGWPKKVGNVILSFVTRMAA